MKKHRYTYDFAMVLCPRWGVGVPWTACGHLVEAVRVHGFSAQFLDFNIELYHSVGFPQLWDDNLHHQFWKTQPLDELLDRIDLQRIDAAVVGFSLTETNIRFSVELARRLKKHDPNKTIVFGGHRVFFPEDPENEVPLDACDVIVKGEGELTLLDILQNGINKNPGTYTPGNGCWEFNGDRDLIDNLDAFPWPRYDDLDWSLYPDRAAGIMGSRGCINHCSFCNDIVRAEHRYRKRSALHVAEEMLYHKARHGIGYVIFNDPLMNGHYGNMDQLCEILLERDFGLPWAGNLAIRANMPTELLEKAHRAGLETAIVGLESGSPKVLKLMNKAFSIEEGEWFLNALHAAGIKIDLNLIVGFPGETEEDFQQTLDFITKLAPKIQQIVSVATFNVDHSDLWDNLEEYGVVKYPHKRHITWHTVDNSNTYAVRVDRAQRLIGHACNLGISHLRLDVDIEQVDQVASLADLRARRRKLFVKHYTKMALQRTGVFKPIKKLASMGGIKG